MLVFFFPISVRSRWLSFHQWTAQKQQCAIENCLPYKFKSICGTNGLASLHREENTQRILPQLSPIKLAVIDETLMDHNTSKSCFNTSAKYIRSHYCDYRGFGFFRFRCSPKHKQVPPWAGKFVAQRCCNYRIQDGDGRRNEFCCGTACPSGRSSSQSCFDSTATCRGVPGILLTNWFK